ncbi:MAG: isoprenylcysteine carboxylmethyltransferase family protein [Candidatus Acidiferrales bacterium]
MTRSTIWLILYWAWVAGEVGILIATRTRSSGGDVRDRGSLRILWIVITVSLTIGISHGEMHEPTMFGGAPWVRTAAAVLLAVALAIRWTAIITLGRWFSVNVAIRDKQTLQTSRIFSIVRHPSYTGLLLVFFAVALHTRNWISFVIILVPCAAALLYRISVEETALRSAFGADYEAYSRTTPKRLIPGIY